MERMRGEREGERRLEDSGLCFPPELWTSLCLRLPQEDKQRTFFLLRC